MTDPKTILMVVGVLALVVASHWARSWVEPDQAERRMRPDLVKQVGLIEGVGDLKTANIFLIRVGDVPDETFTDQITLPTWMTSLSGSTRSAGTSPDSILTADSTSTETTRPTLATGAETDQWSSKMMARITSLPYVVVPLKDGRPTMSVTPQVATLQSVSPRTGRPIEWSAKVPQPTWTIDAAGTVTASRLAAVGTSALYLTHHSERFEFGIGPAGHIVATGDGYEAGPAMSLRIETSLYSF